MELKKVIEKLELRDNINSYSKQKLISKYSKDKESANYFLDMFGDMFVAKTFYPLMIYGKYGDIRELVNTIKEKYCTLDTDMLAKAERINTALDMEEHLSPSDRSQNYDYSQMYALHTDRVGVIHEHSFINFPEYNKMLLDEAKKLERCSKKGIKFPNKNSYDMFLRRAYWASIEDGNLFTETNMIDSCHREYPMLELCHDKSFLYLTTELLDSPDFENKSELMEAALNVIDFSTTFHPYQKDCDPKIYKKIARKTLKNLREYNNKENLIDTENKILKKRIVM